ncbi:hypothetical protein WR25_10329 [Diploscapter pachys]|uniref:Uncharacterized protein n=1 Tax=Diploscapter pachys TaxID=2018661 RepID=A0A2A2KNM4_9BILA|nr:hypothetical protein WR25_10329 [Diploscapter pachys]
MSLNHVEREKKYDELVQKIVDLDAAMRSHGSIDDKLLAANRAIDKLIGNWDTQYGQLATNLNKVIDEWNATMELNEEGAFGRRGFDSEDYSSDEFSATLTMRRSANRTVSNTTFSEFATSDLVSLIGEKVNTHMQQFEIECRSCFQLALDYEDDLSTELARYSDTTSEQDRGTQKEQAGSKLAPKEESPKRRKVVNGKPHEPTNNYVYGASRENEEDVPR